MILTVTINPLLERRYHYSKLELSSANRDGRLVVQAGGKGINVSRQLNKLGTKNLALLFSGGINGKILREALRKENIQISEVITKNETRDSAIIIDESSSKIFSFFGSSPEVNYEEVAEFNSKLEKAIAACEIVVFSGSSPCKATDNIFVKGIVAANKLDKISICDTYGRHLNDCIDASPTILHNNLQEIESSLGITIRSENNNLNFLKTLYKKGIKQAYITDGGKIFYASNFDFYFKVTPPEISSVDSTGSGDAFVAGIVYGWHKKFSFEQQLRFATALGAINSKSFDVCNAEYDDVKSLLDKINVKSVGKKLKEVNDSPD